MTLICARMAAAATVENGERWKMKTLKQLWDKEYHEAYRVSLSADEQDDVELDFEPTRKAIIKWLEQKRKIHYNCAWKDLLDELLEELEYDKMFLGFKV